MTKGLQAAERKALIKREAAGAASKCAAVSVLVRRKSSPKPALKSAISHVRPPRLQCCSAKRKCNLVLHCSLVIQPRYPICEERKPEQVHRWFTKPVGWQRRSSESSARSSSRKPELSEGVYFVSSPDFSMITLVLCLALHLPLRCAVREVHCHSKKGTIKDSFTRFPG